MNRLGYPTAAQVKKLAIAAKFALPKIDLANLERDDHELTFDEYCVKHQERVAKQRDIKALNERILYGTVAGLLRDFSWVKAVLQKEYQDVLMAALTAQLPNIPKEPLLEYEFKYPFFPLIKKYCRHYKIEL